MSRSSGVAIGVATARRGGLRTAVVGAVGVSAALVCMAAPLAGAPAAEAAAGQRVSAACPTDAGVSVVVDFGPYGGIDVACAPRDVGTGLEALEVAGFDWVGTAQFGTFVCRINGLPTAADDQCVRTPPPDAYWSYWSAARGGSWSYQVNGPVSADPAPGTVEGWAFGAGEPPGVAPPAPPAQPPTTAPPTTPPPPPASTSPPPPSPPGGAEDPTTAAVSSPPSTATTGVPTSPTTGETTSPTPEASRPGQPSPTSAESAGDQDEPAGGSPTGTVVGLVSVAAVAAGGAVLALRRGRATPSS